MNWYGCIVINVEAKQTLKRTKQKNISKELLTRCRQPVNILRVANTTTT